MRGIGAVKQTADGGGRLQDTGEMHRGICGGVEVSFTVIRGQELSCYLDPLFYHPLHLTHQLVVLS